MIIGGILDAMAEPSGGRLTPEQRALLQQTITAELRRAWDEAVAAGVPAERLAEIVEKRRLEILSAVVVSDDRKNGGDDPVDDDRVVD
jgi:hypothetical protein